MFAHSLDLVLRAYWVFLHVFFDELNRVWRDLRLVLSALTSRCTFAPRWSVFSVSKTTSDTLCSTCDRLVVHYHVTSGNVLTPIRYDSVTLQRTKTPRETKSRIQSWMSVAVFEPVLLERASQKRFRSIRNEIEFGAYHNTCRWFVMSFWSQGKITDAF